MFERKLTSSNGGNTPAQTVISLVSENGEPVEFIYNGVRFHINEKLTTWLQTNDWWKKLDQGEVKESVSKYWQVEAAPVGALTTFEIEFNHFLHTDEECVSQSQLLCDEAEGGESIDVKFIASNNHVAYPGLKKRGLVYLSTQYIHSKNKNNVTFFMRNLEINNFIPKTNCYKVAV